MRQFIKKTVFIFLCVPPAFALNNAVKTSPAVYRTLSCVSQPERFRAYQTCQSVLDVPVVPERTSRTRRYKNFISLILELSLFQPQFFPEFFSDILQLFQDLR